MSARAVLNPLTCEGPGLDIAWAILVDSDMMSLP